MTTTAKGFTTLQNSDAMQGPTQINAAELFLEGIIGETVALQSSLPISGNWIGRMIFAQDAGMLFINTNGTTGWKSVPRGVLATNKTAGADYSTTAADMATVTANVVANESYLVTGFVGGSQVTNAGTPTIRLLIGGTEVARVLSGITNAAGGIALAGDIAYIHEPVSSGSVIFKLTAQSSAAAFRVAAGAAQIAVAHIGSH